MQLSLFAFITSAAALALRNIHVADFRGFGGTNCFDENLGIWTVIDDDVKHGECMGFNGNDVRSLRVEDVNEGCVSKYGRVKRWERRMLMRVVYVFGDEKCGGVPMAAVQGGCVDKKEGWKAWKMECKVW